MAPIGITNPTCGPQWRKHLRAFGRHSGLEMKQLTCKCGAIYEVTENEVPFKGPYSSRKCILCESELTWIGPNPQFHLIKQPDQDRE